MTRWHPPEGELRADIPTSIQICELQRSDLQSGALPEPLTAQLARLPADGLLEIQADADPARLCAPIEAAGPYLCQASAAPAAGRRWSIEVRAAGAPELLDLRELEAPEPLQRILEAAAALEPGAALLARVPRFPRTLLPQLEQRGLAFEIFEEPDESALVHLRRVHLPRVHLQGIQGQEIDVQEPE